jgi:cation-transporting P-type ATPase F
VRENKFAMENSEKQAWHQLEAEEVARLLEVDWKAGLPEEEVRRRRERYGPNRVTSEKGAGVIRRFLAQFNQPLLYILLAATVVTLLLAEYVDAAVIFGVVLINAIVGFIQESKAEKAIDALARMVVTETTVRREGEKRRIASEEIVPGDVVLLQSGDHVPADLRMLKVRSLQVDESALTGESVPVEKQLGALAGETVLGDRTNLAFAGTLVTYGQAEAVVLAIGDKTETGRIATLISEAVDLSTPLTRKISHFSVLLVWAILGLAGMTFIVGLVRGESAVDMFMAAVALAVGAIPEGLPAAVTITLAIGVSRMAKRRAIIRKLPAVETLGSTTVICSDKTGTLTENQMTVQQVYAGDKFYDVTGSGYETEGEVQLDGQTVSIKSHPALRECLQAGLLCNDARLSRSNGRPQAQGDPTEVALIVAAHKAGLREAELSKELPRLDAIPFESEHQFMATLHDAPSEQRRIIYKKGAVELLLDRCSKALNSAGELVAMEKKKTQAAADKMAASGLRVLAFVRGDAPADQNDLHHEHVQGDLTLLGLQGMIDPPRAEAVDAVQMCQTAGIAVKMITGDHKLTATSIAKQIGLGHGPARFGPRDDSHAALNNELLSITGQELEKLSDSELQDIAEQAAVFARVAPEQKFRLVKALQSRGHIVAMTGDGVNDAPALKQADIGIAMGVTGTEVAKGAADMLLTDDNFASIEAAVEEGRGVFDNLTKFLVWTLPTNGGQAATILAAIFAGFTLPILPVQLLWVNMTTAILLGLMLVFEPKEKDLMRRPPRNPQQPILTAGLLMRTALVTLIMATGAIGLFFWHRAQNDLLEEARTVVVNVVVMVQMFYLFNCRSLTHSVMYVGLFSNRWILVGCASMLSAQMLFTYAPFMNQLFHTAPISGQAWLHILAVALCSSAVVGTEKWIRSRFEKPVSRATTTKATVE